MADGTAPKCGRVGNCHIYLKKPFRNERLFYCTYMNDREVLRYGDALRECRAIEQEMSNDEVGLGRRYLALAVFY
jgi:hypothetical protein